MRTWGRTYAPDGTPTWVEVSTTPDGYNDNVYLTTLIQVLKLNLGESPFYADYGIPAKTSVIQQVFPDFYIVRTQQQFAQYFANLTVAKVPSPTPTYQVSVTFQQGYKADLTVQVPR